MTAAPLTFTETLRAKGLLDAGDMHRLEWLCAHAALREPADTDALARLVALLCSIEAQGSLCLPLDRDRLIAASRDLLGAVPGNGEENAPSDAPWVDRVLALLESGGFNSVIGADRGMFPLIQTHGNLYWHKAWSAARTVADGIRTRCARGTASADSIAAALQETLSTNPLRHGDGAILTLTDAQQRALEGALSNRVFIVAGGPGTGKTTWTAAWLRAALRLPGAHPERIRLCAPTGRAARRLEESLRATLTGVLGEANADARDRAAADMPVTTLHTLLGWRAFEGRFARTPDDPLDADVVLLDEASMADVHLMAALVRALPPHARLLLAGDPGQLPAVEAGAVLAELLPEETSVGAARGPVPSVTLDASHRAKGAVIPLAAALRDGAADVVLALLGEPVDPTHAFAADRPVARVNARESGTARASEGLESLLQAYAGAAFGAVPAYDGAGATYAVLLERFRTLPREKETAAVDALWRLAGRVRVLAPLRQGAVSAESANGLLRRHLEPQWRRRTDARDPGGFHGAPILITRNDARTGLSNGDLGLWLETGDGAMVFFPRPELPGGWLRLPVALLPAYELGFASTVHKSQGSECDEVLVLLPAADNRLLVRETLYTAVTRARRAVRIFGSEDAVRQAVERRLERYGGLRPMLAD